MKSKKIEFEFEWTIFYECPLIQIYNRWKEDYNIVNKGVDITIFFTLIFLIFIFYIINMSCYLLWVIIDYLII